MIVYLTTKEKTRCFFFNEVSPKPIDGVVAVIDFPEDKHLLITGEEMKGCYAYRNTYHENEISHKNNVFVPHYNSVDVEIENMEVK